MINNLFEYIGKELHGLNDYFTTFSVNSIVQGKKVVDFDDESTYKGISDLNGTAFYIRHQRILSFKKGKSITSTQHIWEVSCQARLVAYSVANKKVFNDFVLENKLRQDLQNIHFDNYTNYEEKGVRIEIKRSNSHYPSVYKEEFLCDMASTTRKCTMIAIDFELNFQYINKNCITNEQCLLS